MSPPSRIRPGTTSYAGPYGSGKSDRCSCHTTAWTRPEAYLDPDVQAGMSWLALLPPEARERGSERLAADLASGAWDGRHGHLRRLLAYDGSYRIAIAD